MGSTTSTIINIVNTNIVVLCECLSEECPIWDD